MKTTAAYLSNGKYNPTTDKVDYEITKKEIKVDWYNSIEIDGIETKSIGLYPTYLNGYLDNQTSIFKLSESSFVVYDTWFKETGNANRNDFSNLDDAIKFVESIKLFIDNKLGICVEKN